MKRVTHSFEIRRTAVGIVTIMAALLVGVGSAQATPLAANPDLQQEGTGLSYELAGVGLRGKDEGTIVVPNGGIVQKMVLFWGGRGTLPGDPEILVDGVPVSGTLIGFEDTSIDIAYAYRADVTDAPVITTPQGLSITVADASPQDQSSSLNGASLLVYYNNGSSLFSRVLVFEGSDFAWAPLAPADAGLTAPIFFEHDVKTSPRTGHIGIVNGDAVPRRPDRVEISNNPPVVNQLDGSDNPQWDSDIFDILIPANVSTTRVQVVSPLEDGSTADSVHWILTVMQLTESGGACCLEAGGCQLVASEADCLAQNGSFAGVLSECATAACPGTGGACCFPGGGCAETASSDCDSQGGVYQGDGVECAAAACPVLTGACCISDGSCVETIAGDCASQGGSFKGAGVTCDSAPCIGACCLPDGFCFETTAAICPLALGSFQGIDTVCAQADCPTPGACCFADGSCVQSANADGNDCVSAGGVYQGTGTSCASNPCPQPTGACCFADGSCQVLTSDQCASQSGSYAGNDVSCAAAACPQPDGACCLADGSCVVATAESCAGQGGVFQGAGADCATTPCPGACCLVTGSCSQQRADTCAISGGTYLGFATSCADADCPQPGACCTPTGACMQSLLVGGLDCVASGGNYQGDDTTCGTAQCAGACCLPDGSCFETSAAMCASQGGSFEGLGTTCDSGPCAGACCLPDGFCFQTTVDICTSSLGTYQGLATNCSTTDCPQPGACCFDDGTCVQAANVDGNDCDAGGGIYQGAGTTCDANTCPQPGACCLDDGTCVQAAALGGADCTAQGGSYQGDDTLCASVTCPQPGACCLGDGTCVQAAALGGADCTAQGGTYQGDDSLCASVTCPQPGACCLADGTCVQATDLAGSDCAGLGGSYQGVDTVCATAGCPQPGACCLDDGSCVPAAQLNGNDCFDAGGEYQGVNTLCVSVTCPQPGACCLPDGSCVQSIVKSGADCLAQGGVYQGDDTACGSVSCPQPPPPALDDDDRVDVNKGSLLVYSAIEIRWDDEGRLFQDTFVDMTNDYPEDVRVQMYFVNGDPPLAADGDERAHPGWNHVSVEIMLTKNQPVYWSALSGFGAIGVAPFTVLDQDTVGNQPGRPDPDGSSERVLRGFIVAWAVDADNEEIRWNHLKGDAVQINYHAPYAWEYQAWAFPAGGAENGDKTGTPGVLNLDGEEYARCFSQLVLDFYAPVATPFEHGDATASVHTDLTLHPVTVDLRQEDDGPVTTKAKIDVWNQNEVKFNGMERCITCWDQRLLEHYTEFGIPNNFLLANLQTNKGKARIEGLQSENCDFDFNPVDGPLGFHPLDVVSEDAALLGVVAKYLDFNPGAAAAGTNLHGMGLENAVIMYDELSASQEASSPGR